MPTLLAALARLNNAPDLIFVDGHGISHPRRFGIASHLGVVLDCPTVGCAKSLLVGDVDEPEDRLGATSELIHKEELIGYAVRTRIGVQPIFVSTGHRVSLKMAVKLALSVGDGFRVPKPTREADKWVGKVKKTLTEPGKFDQIEPKIARPK
jgi:deoxyribonuclease V